MHKVTLEYKMKFVQDKPFLYIVHPTGTYIDPHTDILDIDEPDYENDTYESQIEKYPYLWSGHLSVLGYLNDDYEGGELSFGGWNYTYKPVAGDLVIFPSNYMYTHRAMPVTSGTKYALATMLDYSDKYHSPEIHQNKQY